MADLRADFVKVTPLIAREWLELNTRNRKMNEIFTEDYAVQMKEGEWEDDTGEAIKFNVDGALIDGQKRLKAQIESNTTHTYLVVYGLPRKAIEKIDLGQKRSGADALHILGVKNAVQISAEISRYLMFKRGRGYGETGGTTKRGITVTHIVHEYQRRSEYWQNITLKALEWNRAINRYLAPSDIGGFFTLLKEKSNEDATKFFDKLCLGTGLTPKSPIMLLRNKILYQNNTLRSRERYALIIKAWNLFRQGKTVDKLKYDFAKEKFPKPI